mgnify:CR=1 FL=1
MRVETRRRWAIFGLTGPAYLWLTITIFLPLSAMLYFSFQKKGPFGKHASEFTLKHYEAFFTKDYLQALTWRSLFETLAETSRTSATLFTVLIGALIFSSFVNTRYWVS